MNASSAPVTFADVTENVSYSARDPSRASATAPARVMESRCVTATQKTVTSVVTEALPSFV